MKLIIDIPEIEYNTKKIMGYFSDDSKILKAVANGTPIPDNATNDVLEQIRQEIETEITPNLSDEQTQAFIYVLQIIDKHITE